MVANEMANIPCYGSLININPSVCRHSANKNSIDETFLGAMFDQIQKLIISCLITCLILTVMEKLGHYGY